MRHQGLQSERRHSLELSDATGHRVALPKGAGNLNVVKPSWLLVLRHTSYKLGGLVQPSLHPLGVAQEAGCGWACLYHVRHAYVSNPD